MPSSPHLMCSMCDTNVDTGHESELQQDRDRDSDETKTWLISCDHVVCNSCYTSIIHASKRWYLCKHCHKKYEAASLDPQRIHIYDTIPAVVGESRGLQEIADKLLKERNRILREGSEILQQFKKVQDEVEKEDAKLESFIDRAFGSQGRFTDETGRGAGASMQGGVDNSEEWIY